MRGEPPPKGEISELLKAWSDGEPGAADEIMPLVYGELRRQARRYLRRERANHTLQSTALVHEAYIRLVGQRDVTWQNRAHFFGIAAEMMRRILVNYALRAACEKRGGEAVTVAIDGGALQIADRTTDVNLIELDQALDRLANLDGRQAKVVELKYFGGLSIEETAEVLGVSNATVKREWNMARTWLRAELGG
jgi:RNA polymerase sigma factor (TIGR02999 family)